MRKKDYIAMADALRPIYNRAKEASVANAWNPQMQAEGEASLRAVEACVDATANVFASDNPRFNHSRWFSYLRGECGPNGGAVKH